MRSMRALFITALASMVVLVPFVASGSAATSGSTGSCAGAVSWSSASRMIGKIATSDSPTFLNLGRDYPSLSRFTVVIWGENRGRFGTPERTYRGKTICVRGRITSYGGVAEIEATSPNQIAVV